MHRTRQRVPLGTRLLRRGASVLLVVLTALAGFYWSLAYSASPLTDAEHNEVHAAVEHLRSRGFRDEAFLLSKIAVFRRNDHWLNASVEKEQAFAATNFPFGIVTLYPDFFVMPKDEIERAAILLHEAKHIEGKEEKGAYEFVWRHRKQLGWTAETHGTSQLWSMIRLQTAEYAPDLFSCELNIDNDCTAEARPPGYASKHKVATLLSR